VNPFEPRHVPVVAAVYPLCAERWPRFRPAILAMVAIKVNQGIPLPPTPIPGFVRGARAVMVEFLPLRLCASARDRLFCLALVSRTFTLWQALAI
jgi:hypothetical protein